MKCLAALCGEVLRTSGKYSQIALMLYGRIFNHPGGNYARFGAGSWHLTPSPTCTTPNVFLDKCVPSASQ